MYPYQGVRDRLLLWCVRMAKAIGYNLATLNTGADDVAEGYPNRTI